MLDTLPWPQSPTKKQIDAVASSLAAAVRRVRVAALQQIDGGLRAFYRTLDLPGKNPLKDAHAALDSAVLAAYGFDPKKTCWPNPSPSHNAKTPVNRSPPPACRRRMVTLRTSLRTTAFGGDLSERTFSLAARRRRWTRAAHWAIAARQLDNHIRETIKPHWDKWFYQNHPERLWRPSGADG